MKKLKTIESKYYGLSENLIRALKRGLFKRYFAHLEEYEIACWKNGRTSETAGGECPYTWDHAGIIETPDGSKPGGVK